jgi:hypothetical protein
MAFRRFVRDFEHTCQCGNTFRLKREFVTIHRASRGEASYRFTCEVCRRSGFGFFGSTEFVQSARASADVFCEDRGLPKPFVQWVPDVFVEGR